MLIIFALKTIENNTLVINMIGDHDVMSKKFSKLSPVTNLLLYIYRVFFK